MAVCQNLVPLVNIKIAGKWMFIPLKIVLIGIDPYPYENQERKTLGKIAGITHLTPSPVFDEAALFGKGLPRTSAIRRCFSPNSSPVCCSPNLPWQMMV